MKGKASACEMQSLHPLGSRLRKSNPNVTSKALLPERRISVSRAPGILSGVQWSIFIYYISMTTSQHFNVVTLGALSQDTGLPDQYLDCSGYVQVLVLVLFCFRYKAYSISNDLPLIPCPIDKFYNFLLHSSPEYNIFKLCTLRVIRRMSMNGIEISAVLSRYLTSAFIIIFNLLEA